MDLSDIVSVALSALAVLFTFRKKRKLTLPEAAGMGVNAAAQCVKEPKDRLAFAMDVVRKLDVVDGKRDWNDAKIRLAVEAEVQRRKA